MFPEGYADSFTNYVTMNRAGKELVAKMYANGKAVKGQDGIYEIDELAAVAVMERRGAWDAAYPRDDRVGDWGFAIYNPNGTPKKNELNCPVCYTPLKEQDYLYTHLPLLDYARR